MSTEPIRLRMLLDAGVPDSMGNVLAESGHEVIFYRDVLPERTPDLVVARTALENGAVLVAIDNDMRNIAKKYGVAAQKGRFAQLSLIHICCDEVMASKRLKQAISFIELEWAISTEHAARRMWVDIGPHFLKTNR